jgi:hypothetical protein
MDGTRYGITPEEWDRAVDEVEDILVGVARRRGEITYSEVVDRVTTVRLSANSPAFHQMLGDVSARAFDAGAPLLSAVVIRKGDGYPGPGFANLARRLGFTVESGDEPELEFWGQQLERVREWWRR